MTSSAASRIRWLCVSLSVSLTWQLVGAWNIQRPPLTTGLFATKSVSEPTLQQNSVLKGVSEFEKWIAAIPGASSDGSIFHEDFGVRGLACDKSLASNSQDWLTIPRSVVLQSDFNEADWDSKLAQQLWQEVRKGPASSIGGYVALLTQGSAWREECSDAAKATPPSTAPDALRHWSEKEKELLSSSSEGQRLLDLEKQQEEMWRAKYEYSPGMTYEQFCWAMEAVHSRAFCGDFGIAAGSSVSNAITVSAPIIAAIGGFAYYVPFHGQNDAILLALAALAAAPLFLNIWKQGGPVAVLLPLIDSANHLQEADSSIQYSPMNDCFALRGGSSCLVAENDGKRTQLYISYGKKKDTELLLNYGFLRGVESAGDPETRRRKLAEAFLQKSNGHQV